MGTRSTAVKQIRRYRLPHEGGLFAEVLEVIYVDPSDPDVCIITRDVRPPVALEFIKLDLKVGP